MLLTEHRTMVAAMRVAAISGASERHKIHLTNRLIQVRRELRRRGVVRTYVVRDDDA